MGMAHLWHWWEDYVQLLCWNTSCLAPGTVLLENPPGDSGLQLWVAVTAKKKVFQDCCVPQCKTEIPLGSSSTSHLQGSASACQAGPCPVPLGLQNFGIHSENWRIIGHILTIISVSNQQYHVPPSAQEFWCPGNFGRSVKAAKMNLDRGYIPWITRTNILGHFWATKIANKTCNSFDKQALLLWPLKTPLRNTE